MKMLSTATIVLLVSLAAVAQDKPRGTQLKNTDLTQTFLSGTIAIGNFDVQTLSVARLYLRGGVTHVIYADPDGNGDYARGQWRIDQDTLCTTSQASVGVTEQCATVYKLSDGSYESWVNGKRSTTFRLIPPPIASALKPTG